MSDVNFDEKLKLVEFELRARVESYVWQRLSRLGWTLGILATILGILGVPTALNQIEVSVASAIKAELKEETEALKDRIQKDLAGLAIETEKLHQEAEKGRTLLAQIASDSEKLRTLQENYASLEQTTSELSERIRQTQLVSAKAAKDTASLKSDVTGAEAEPVITEWSGNVAGDMLEIGGSNFGASPGRVTMFWIAHPSAPFVQDDTLFSDAVELDGTDSEVWTDSEITIRYSDEVRERARQWEADHAGEETNIMVRITTADGRNATTSDRLPESP